MKTILLLLVFLAVISIASPAYTDPIPASSPSQKSGPALVAKAGKLKVPFAVKHPKLHKLGRDLRRRVQTTAEILSPYFQIMTGVFETALYFKK